MPDSSSAVDLGAPMPTRHQDDAMPGCALKLGESIHDEGRDQRAVVDIGLESLLDQRPIVDFAQYDAADADIAGS